jgi:hypothetical protein
LPIRTCVVLFRAGCISVPQSFRFAFPHRCFAFPPPPARLAAGL